MLGFYRIFQPDTVQQYEKMGGKGNRNAEALIQRLGTALYGWPMSLFGVC